MESATTTVLIRRYLGSIEGRRSGNRLKDGLDEDVVEVLAEVPWVRESLAEFAPSSAPEDQRDMLFCLEALAA